MPRAGPGSPSPLGRARTLRRLLPLVGLLVVALQAAGAGGAPPHGAFLPSDPPLRVQANASSLTGPAPMHVTFRATAHGGSGHGVRYHWDFGDDGQGYGRMAVHTYEGPGTYQVVLRGTDNGSGAVASDALNVTVLTSPGPLPSPGTGGAGSPPGSWSWAGLLGGAVLLVLAGILVLLALGSVPGRTRAFPAGALLPAGALRARPLGGSRRGEHRRPRAGGALRTGRASAASPHARGLSLHLPRSAPGTVLLASDAVRPAPDAPVPAAEHTSPAPPEEAPDARGSIWVRSPPGAWELRGHVHLEEATPEWQRSFRDALGIPKGAELAVLPPGTSPPPGTRTGIR